LNNKENIVMLFDPEDDTDDEGTTEEGSGEVDPSDLPVLLPS